MWPRAGRGGQSRRDVGNAHGQPLPVIPGLVSIEACAAWSFNLFLRLKFHVHLDVESRCCAYSGATLVVAATGRRGALANGRRGPLLSRSIRRSQSLLFFSAPRQISIATDDLEGYRLPPDTKLDRSCWGRPREHLRSVLLRRSARDTNINGADHEHQSVFSIQPPCGVDRTEETNSREMIEQDQQAYCDEPRSQTHTARPESSCNIQSNAAYTAPTASLYLSSIRNTLGALPSQPKWERKPFI